MKDEGPGDSLAGPAGFLSGCGCTSPWLRASRTRGDRAAYIFFWIGAELTEWSTYTKGALVAAVAVAMALETREVPDWLKIAARYTLGLGAMFGIASTGFVGR